MSSATGKMEIDKSPNNHSSRNLSTDTLRTRRSHRSVSRDHDHDKKDRRREPDERRKRSRSRDRGSERGYRDRSRDGYRDRDRDRRRDREDRGHRSSRHDGPDVRHGRRDRDRGDRERGDRDRERDRDRDREDRDRRRKRTEDYDGPERDHDDRVKRKRSETLDDIPPPPPNLPPPPPPRDSPRSARSGDRRRGDKNDYDDPRSARRRSRPLDDDDDELGMRSPPPPGVRRGSPSYPSYDNQMDDPYNPDEPKEDDSEARSVFVSQLAARLTARDLGYFFEDKLGEGTVMDSRIVTDRLSRRSKGIGYVEFRSIDLVEKALALSGTVVMGLPIMVQLTESERNKLHPGDGSLNLPPGVTSSHGSMQLYVGSLHFNLTESDIKQVFEPFGELEFVDLHRDPMTGRSKGYAFVQYKRSEDARMALEQMEGFELAGRTLRVNTVHEKGTAKYTQQDSLDEAGGGNLNAASRQALMQKLARTESAPSLPEPAPRVNIPQSMQSRSVLLKNMFDPEEETERDWDKDLAEDVKGECENKYGSVTAIKVEKETQGEIYVKFETIESAKKAIQGLNGRWFGGRQVSAAFISDAIMQAHQ
ncbi:RNA-binding protein rsd1 [Psilocybe cubensis]|uniref:RRM domain-containing protein n=2 Tax=Psilocybe cubensis TaxID=181762 RepID=A0A8H7YB43_PSICU|nr:RNA-binding protein rsd1 [Psilocybe cubensis]KAH9486968.1 RNA-binding protein rsd1 [Psilocybe cubensis]